MHVGGRSPDYPFGGRELKAETPGRGSATCFVQRIHLTDARRSGLRWVESNVNHWDIACIDCADDERGVAVRTIARYDRTEFDQLFRAAALAIGLRLPSES